MAQKFKGFTTQQTATLLQKLGYTGPANDEAMNQFVTATPSAAAKMGKYAQTAQRMIDGKPAAMSMPPATQGMAMATGGTVTPKLNTAEKAKADAAAKTAKLVADKKAAADKSAKAKSTPKGVTKPTADTKPTPVKGYTPGVTPVVTNPAPQMTVADKAKVASNAVPKADVAKNGGIKVNAPVANTPATTPATTPAAPMQAQTLQAGVQDMAVDAYTNPSALVTSAKPATVQENANQLVSPTAGDITTPATTVTPTTAAPAAQATAPVAATAETVDTTTTQAGAQNIAAGTTAAQGTVSKQDQVAAATMKPEDLAQLNVDAAQITKAQTVQAPAARALQAGESISGSAVDMAKVNEASQVVAAQALPSKQATVAGQLEGLMSEFDNGKTPAWAAGAMRAANAMLVQRGLGASSIAGQAVIQAAMESALPIAQADAATRASFESQNLSNRQQSAVLSAQLRADFLKQDFDQAFQTRVTNAAKISDIANMNFTAEQQIALENAQLAQTVDLTNLGAKNAKILADVAAMSQLDMTNLNNRQQAAVQNAQAFLQMDMTNLDNKQQTSLFKSQALLQSLFTDAAAENASKQFNASSQNQVKQFYDSLTSQVQQYNVGQKNAMSQFNVDQENAIKKFNAETLNQRDQFEATNTLVIAQANAQWRQQIATTNAANKQQSNMQDALAATGITTQSLANIWQRERDIMAFAFQGSENAADRAANVAMAKLTASQESKLAKDTATGAFAARLILGGADGSGGLFNF